jgi:glyoxylase-like metal-dependent hydrolase (beta-lactamase superfamily II)
MPPIEVIPIPLPHVGSVNAWVLRGEPITLLDTGPRSEEALDALERGLRALDLRIEDIELVIGTHHHHDHVGLAATVKRRSGARIAVLAQAAEYGANYADGVLYDRTFSHRLMADHGFPRKLAPTVDELWDYISATAESFEADARLQHGDRIRAGSRELTVVARPGHSRTDTLFIDRAARLAFVGDHLLAKISANTEIYRAADLDADSPRSRSRLAYVDGLKRTARMPLVRLFSGHGPSITAHRELVTRQLGQQRRRCARLIRLLEDGPATAYEAAQQMWSDAIVRDQPLLVLWEVLGHLDLLLAAGIAQEDLHDDGQWRYALARSAGPKARQHGGECLAQIR